MKFDQADFEVRCEWGEKGVLQLAPISDVVIVVDILSFSTCIDIANSRGAIVFPYPWQDESVQAFAQSVDAEIAEKRGGSRYSLSPTSLLEIEKGTRLVLPSPNGSTLSLATCNVPTLAGCLRNYRSVALAAMEYGRHIAVIPAGEKWQDGSLRPSFEDFVGAGAVLSHLKGRLSPESQLAIESYRGVQSSLKQLIKQCGSGQELIERGFGRDVDLALEVDVSHCIPTLLNGTYIDCAKKQDSRIQ
jgi:2-phosphosulfolactate phosphatase